MLSREKIESIFDKQFLHNQVWVKHTDCLDFAEHIAKLAREDALEEAAKMVKDLHGFYGEAPAKDILNLIKENQNERHSNSSNQ